MIKHHLTARAPELTFAVANCLVSDHKSKLGDAAWDIIEKLFLAAAQLGEAEVANNCVAMLEKQFTIDSVRVGRLEAMRMELEGDNKEALEAYKEIIKKDPANSFVLKRIAALHRSEGDLAAAIAALDNYLKLYYSDETAWLELADVYVASEKYDMAQFCYEELVLLAPQNYVYHLSLAEVAFTRGQRENIATARNYYAQALELKPENNLRALYGLHLCFRALKTHSAPSQLPSWTAAKIRAIYETEAPHLLALVNEALSS